MSEHQETQDGHHQVVLPPALRAWFDLQRSWHQGQVRVQAETRWVADGTAATVAIHLVLADGRRGRRLQQLPAQVRGGRLVGADGARGCAHALDWRLPQAELGAQGVQAVVELPDYGVQATSQLLLLDLQPFLISG